MKIIIMLLNGNYNECFYYAEPYIWGPKHMQKEGVHLHTHFSYWLGGGEVSLKYSLCIHQLYRLVFFRFASLCVDHLSSP